jgi:uncharacterized damage-inducible protein DinB
MDMTPVESSIVEMFRHNRWANLRLLDACLNLSDEQLAASVPGTYGSLRDTLLHLVKAEALYLRILNGEPRAQAEQLGQSASIAQLRERAAMLGEALAQVAGHIGPNDTFPDRGEDRIYQLPGPRFLAQVTSHATEHRSQVATILTQLGIEPPDMSCWAYMEEMGLESQPV